MIKNCQDHLCHINEDYFTHMGFALKIAALCMLAAFFLIIHAVIPGIFLHNGSHTIEKISGIIAARKEKNNAAAQ